MGFAGHGGWRCVVVVSALMEIDSSIWFTDADYLHHAPSAIQESGRCQSLNLTQHH